MFKNCLAIAVFRNKDAVVVCRPEQFIRMDEEHVRRIGETVEDVDEKAGGVVAKSRDEHGETSMSNNILNSCCKVQS